MKNQYELMSFQNVFSCPVHGNRCPTVGQRYNGHHNEQVSSD